ncbi:MAG: ActS/PrrB/RegB family redox-sensitive histidine kinase [Pseudomonadota bacterium]
MTQPQQATIAGDLHGSVDASRGPVRLRTLTGLRWLAVGGQGVAIAIVHLAFGFPLPLGLCMIVIAASAWLNLFTILRFSPQRFLTDQEAGAFIAFDIIQLCVLLALTGGLLNPFSALIIAPVTIAASFLTLRYTALIAALALVGVSVLALYHMPLPWRPGETLELAPIYKLGVWAALSFTILFFAAYAHRIAAESMQVRSALAATQTVLAREQRLSALGGLAAAAAHELGTPLATIQLTAREMQSELPEDSPLAEDAGLLVDQAKRCREILGRLSSHGEAGDLIHDRIDVETLLEEAASPFLEKAASPALRIEAESRDGSPEPVLRRRPEIVYGLRNFIENAIGFARADVRLIAFWDRERLTVTIDDDGPGFAPEILSRLGEPYVSSRDSARPGGRPMSQRTGGMGLGFFIAKALLEGTDATIAWSNRPAKPGAMGSGARVRVSWPLAAIVAQPEQGAMTPKRVRAGDATA